MNSDHTISLKFPFNWLHFDVYHPFFLWLKALESGTKSIISARPPVNFYPTGPKSSRGQKSAGPTGLLMAYFLLDL